MRILEVITEDVVLKLEKGLKKLPSHSYDSIDKLMQKICKDADISGKKLHDMFVDKHNLTPDTWIKKQVDEDWKKVNKHDKTDGMSQKAVNAYRKENPGSKLKTAVTTKPSKLKAGSKDAKRRKSFCARMSGNKGPMKKPNGKPTPKALALRRWHCESLFELFVTARKGIYEAEGEPSGLKHLTPHLARDILDQMEKEGVHAIVKSIEWGDGGAKELIAMIKRDLEQVAAKKKSLTPNDIHALADSKGVAWDDEPSFLQLTKRLTGKEHLDDLDQAGLLKVKNHLENLEENFADGKNPGRKGLAKRSGVNTKASVSSLRKTAKHSTGEKARMAHWLANMKAGRERAAKEDAAGVGTITAQNTTVDVNKNTPKKNLRAFRL